MGGLAEKVRDSVFWYASDNDLVKTFKLIDEAEQVYAVNLFNKRDRQKNAIVAVIARIQGDLVIIEEDLTDKPLLDRLIAAGVPRDKIILAYMGEPVPEPTPN